MKALLAAILGGPLWVDAQAQRAVDAGVHALMRAGASKATIRYTINGAALLCGLSSEICNLIAGESLWWILALAIFVTVYLFIQRQQRRIDENEAAKGILHQRSDPMARSFWWTMLAVEACVVIHSGHGLHRQAGIFNAAFDVLILVNQYSALTPPRPPARHVRALVPAEART